MSQMRCPICRVTFDSDHSSALPFCCSRCRQIDLNRWLGEAYSLPVDSEEEPAESEIDEE